MPDYHDVTEVAKKLKRHPHTIRDWIRFGCPAGTGKVRLPATKFGKKWMVRAEALELFEHRVRSPAGRPDLELE